MDIYDILNGLSELVYIADTETYDLLYLNDSGVKIFGDENYQCRKCYDLLQNRTEPCEFCTNSVIDDKNFYTWNHTNEITKRQYMLKDKLIKWKDRTARIEIAFDITESENAQRMTRNMLDMETILVKCIQELHKNNAIEIRINNLLKIIGESLVAERVYVFDIDYESGQFSNTFEWCAEGVSSEIDNLQKLDIQVMSRWLPYFENDQCVVIENVEDTKEISPDEYNTLHVQNIHSLIAAPLKINGKLSGYIGVDNPPKGKIEIILPFFTTLSYFLSSSILKYQNEEKLKCISYHDALTGLNNRNKYMQDIQEYESGNFAKLGVVFIDLNGLKDINDQCGHECGDNALKEVAEILKSCFGDYFVYRLGGDEFIVLCIPIERQKFHDKVAALKQRFAESNIFCAVGTEYASVFSRICDVIRNADENMYHDKKLYYHTNKLSNRYRHNADVFTEFSDEKSLTQLLKQNRFILLFQPKFYLKDLKIQSAEALVRFQDRKSNLILPDKFIQSLENSDLCYLVDFFVLDRVCKFLSERIEAGKKICPVSVNFSRGTLLRPDFISELNELWNRYNLDKSLVEIEINEDSNVDAMQKVLGSIIRLKAEGYKISIDDFGSKYANLFLFSSIEFDVLKLDKSLIDTLTIDSKSYSIIKSITEICHKHNISIVAEGIENLEQLDMINKLDSDVVQGYMFEKPMPISEFTKKYLDCSAN